MVSLLTVKLAVPGLFVVLAVAAGVIVAARGGSISISSTIRKVRRDARGQHVKTERELKIAIGRRREGTR